MFHNHETSILDFKFQTFLLQNILKLLNKQIILWSKHKYMSRVDMKFREENRVGGKVKYDYELLFFFCAPCIINMIYYVVEVRVRYYSI